MSRLRCVVERITYQNPENGYSVIKARVKGYDELVTVVGSLLDVTVGSVLLVEGEWKVDSRYGSQFSAVKWEETVPATIYGMEKYLGSGMIKGIGPAFARRIVDRFGLSTIDVIEDDIARLLEVPGLGTKRVESIRESWERQKDIKNIMLFLQGYGVSCAYAAKIYRTYGKESIDNVKSNPYRLADDIWGIGFKTADTIASKLGMANDNPFRLRSGILYSLGQLADQGHVFATGEQVEKAASEILSVPSETVSDTVETMVGGGDLIKDGEAVYLPPFYYAETGVVNRMKELAHAANCRLPFPVDIASIERSTGMVYDPVQVSAVETAVASKVSVLTGGPGTGKTTTVCAVIAALRSIGCRVLLAAPTGRAAKRMTEATGIEAQTIHSLLECKPPEGFRRNEDNPLDGDALIVDEFSMVDILLMNSLLKAMPNHMRLVMVGDVDQLPSVGAGNVLRDVIGSGAVAVVRLTRIFRQAMKSRIITNAHRVNSGKFPDISNGRDSDFFFIDEEDPETAAATVVDLVKRRLPIAYGFSSSDIQVLTPMRRGVVGATALNSLLQDALNSSQQLLRRSGYTFRLGDRVMQIRNNYDKRAFNGDIGTITDVDMQERTLTVDFSGISAVYDVSELDELTLAYAATVHKSQGSEYPVVVIPVLMTHFVMLERNLVYTAITRARKLCVVVGSRRALHYAVSHVKAVNRNSNLCRRLTP